MKRLAIVLLAVTLFGACAGDEPEEDTLASPAAQNDDIQYDDPSSTTKPEESAGISAGGDCQTTPPDQPADLEMQDFVFAPTCLEVTSGQGLRIHNEGQATHNWTLETGLDVDVRPGEENNTEATGLEPGTYDFFCKYHKDSKDMTGELRVKSG